MNRTRGRAALALELELELELEWTGVGCCDPFELFCAFAFAADFGCAFRFRDQCLGSFDDFDAHEQDIGAGFAPPTRALCI